MRRAHRRSRRRRASCRCSTRRRTAARSIARSASRMPGAFTGWPRREPRSARAEPPPADGVDHPRHRRRRLAGACAPMMPRPSAPNAAPCSRGLRGRLPAAELIAERGGRIAGFLLGRDGRMAAQIGPLIAEDDDDRARAAGARARCGSTGRCSSISPTPRREVRELARSPRLRRRAAVHAHAARQLAALRRRRAHLRGGRAGVRMSAGQDASSACDDAARADPRNHPIDQYSFGGLIGGILTFLSRNSLV